MSENQANAKSTSNQNTLTLIVIAMLVIIAFMMFFNMTQKISTSASTSANTDKLIALRQSVANKERELRALGIELPADTSSIEELSSRINRDAMKLRNNVETIQTALSKKEAALTQTQFDLKGAITTNQHLSNEAAKLRSQLAQIEGQQANVAFLKQEVDTLKSTLAARDKQINELSKRPTPETVAQFRASLNETMLTNEKLNKKNSELELQALKAVNNADVDRMRAENQEMRIELQRLRADNDYEALYAKSAEELRPEAALLYRELEKLEGLSLEALKAAYLTISQEHNAHMIHTVRFKTNSSEISWDCMTPIKDIVTTANKDSFFLVVGYASKTSNKLLSTKRSVTIASIIKHLKGGMGTRAVFLGQTDRFSPQPLDNQICEIWELRK